MLKFVSDTTAGCGNQSFFVSDGSEIMHSRAFYRFTVGGEGAYSLLFSNIIDSTYSDGKHSHANYIPKSYIIHSVKACVCDDCDPYAERRFVSLAFDGEEKKTVHSGEFFESDPISLNPKKGQYLLVDMEFSGEEIPCHPECLIPAYRLTDGKWIDSRNLPYVLRLGSKRNVKCRIGFLGDSITQGYGTAWNSYTHWNALLADMLGDGYALWNLGIGYGRASDAAEGGAWLYKAKQNDVVVLCFGVNDLLQTGVPGEVIGSNIKKIVNYLLDAGVRVFIQTVPPFGYDETVKARWERVNEYIKTEIVPLCIGFFDVVPVLGQGGDKSHMPKYGGHPDAEGCRIWAETLFPVLKKSLDEFYGEN